MCLPAPVWFDYGSGSVIRWQVPDKSTMAYNTGSGNRLRLAGPISVCRVELVPIHQPSGHHPGCVGIEWGIGKQFKMQFRMWNHYMTLILENKTNNTHKIPSLWELTPFLKIQGIIQRKTDNLIYYKTMTRVMLSLKCYIILFRIRFHTHTKWIPCFKVWFSRNFLHNLSAVLWTLWEPMNCVAK